MDGKKEQAFVGLFVLVAVALLLVTIFSLTASSAARRRSTMPGSPSPAAWSRARRYATRAARKTDESLRWPSIPMILP